MTGEVGAAFQHGQVQHPEQSTLADRVAELFRSQPNTWIDGRRLAEVAGLYGWRTRVSDIRRAPFHMKILNRQRTIKKADGGRYVISEYKFSPDAEREDESPKQESTTAPITDLFDLFLSEAR